MVSLVVEEVEREDRGGGGGGGDRDSESIESPSATSLSRSPMQSKGPPTPLIIKQLELSKNKDWRPTNYKARESCLKEGKL